MEICLYDFCGRWRYVCGLREACLQQHSLDNSILCHIAQANPERPIAARHQRYLVHIVHAFVHPDCSNSACTAIADNQPFRLELIGALHPAYRCPHVYLLRNTLQHAMAAQAGGPARHRTMFTSCAAAATGHEQVRIQQSLHSSWKLNWNRDGSPNSQAAGRTRSSAGPIAQQLANLMLCLQTARTHDSFSIAQYATPTPCAVSPNRWHRRPLQTCAAVFCRPTCGSWAGVALDVEAAHKRIKVCPAEQAHSFASGVALCTITQFVILGLNSLPTGGNAWAHCLAACYTACSAPHSIACGCMWTTS